MTFTEIGRVLLLMTIFALAWDVLLIGQILVQDSNVYGQVEEAKQELITAAKEVNAGILEALDTCYPIDKLSSEKSRLLCDEILTGLKQTCDERTEQITNTPACEDPRIDSYLKVRQPITVVDNTAAGENIAAPPSKQQQQNQTTLVQKTIPPPPPEECNVNPWFAQFCGNSNFREPVNGECESGFILVPKIKQCVDRDVFHDFDENDPRCQNNIDQVCSYDGTIYPICDGSVQTCYHNGEICEPNTNREVCSDFGEEEDEQGFRGGVDCTAGVDAGSIACREGRTVEEVCKDNPSTDGCEKPEPEPIEIVGGTCDATGCKPGEGPKAQEPGQKQPPQTKPPLPDPGLAPIVNPPPNEGEEEEDEDEESGEDNGDDGSGGSNEAAGGGGE
jgi:hypothetical protein